MKKIIVISGLLGLFLLTPICSAANVSIGTSGTIGNIELIRITIDPYGHPIKDAERLLAEREVIDRITSQKVYFSEQERIIDQLKESYDIEELQKDGKTFWKCIPKNPKTIKVKKSRQTVQRTEYEVIHTTEYYYEDEPNPNYLEAKDLEDKTVWFEVKKAKLEKQANVMQDLY